MYAQQFYSCMYTELQFYLVGHVFYQLKTDILVLFCDLLDSPSIVGGQCSLDQLIQRLPGLQFLQTLLLHDVFDYGLLLSLASSYV